MDKEPYKTKEDKEEREDKGTDDKSRAVRILRGLAATLEKESVRMDDFDINIQNGLQHGESQGGYITHALDGTVSLKIEASYYDGDLDRSHEAHTQ